MIKKLQIWTDSDKTSWIFLISEVKINGSIKYKVLMGSFKNLGDAESYQTMLKKDFKIESIILWYSRNIYRVICATIVIDCGFLFYKEAL